jgi:hypothetical protein
MAWHGMAWHGIEFGTVMYKSNTYRTLTHTRKQASKQATMCVRVLSIPHPT